MSEVTTKRRPSVSENAERSNKRPLLNSLSEEGPLTVEDVAYFQKEAIFRQMRYYKKQYDIVNSQLKAYRQEATKDAEKISCLTAWYSQILASYKIDDSVEVDERVISKLVEGDEDLDRLRDSFLKVLSNVKTSATSGELTSKLNQMSKDFAQLSSSKALLEKDEKVLRFQVESLQNEVLALTKQYDRATSKTVQRVANGVIKEEEVKQESTDSPGGGVASTAGGATDVKKEDVVDNEKFEKLTLELNELKDTNSHLMKQLNEEIAGAAELRKEFMNLTLRLTNLKQEDLMKSNAYQGLKQENETLNDELSSFRLKAKEYFSRITELEAEKSQLQKNLFAEVNKEKTEITNNLQKVEQDLVRIRTTRDDLISKNSVLKSDKSYKVILDEMTSLIEFQKKRIEDLTNAKHETVDEMKNGNDLSKEQLLEQNSLLVSELKEVEAAFKEAHEASIKKLLDASETSSLINKLNVEKSKADQKYFSSMRVNDSLQAENKISKVTIAKQQELINSLKEIEKKYQSRLEAQDLRLKDMKFLENNLANENQQYKKRAIELQKKIETLSEQSEMLSKISETATAEKNSEVNFRKQKESEIAKLGSKLKHLEALMAKYKSNLTGTVLQEDQEQINALRTMVKCSVCSKNWKDTVIKNCGHVFCNDCAQERLAARLRRCPSCNKQFSSNDLLTIHL